MTKAQQASSADSAPSSAQPTQQGKILFVGAGPGNPDLLTVRAREVLSQHAIALVDADVPETVRAVVGSALPVPEDKRQAFETAYAALVAEAKANGARRRPPRPPEPTAAEITVADSMTPDEVIDWLLEVAAEGEDVIRLVGGNPLSSDDALAEISVANRRDVDFHIVPGMSLPATVPTFAGIAVGSTYTEVDLTHGEVDWDQLATAPQPLIVQSEPAGLSSISAHLLERGLSSSTPVSVTVHGTTALQRTHDVTLGTLGKLDADLEGKLVVTVGRGVDSRSKYSWWENRPLYGWRVLVPRAKSQAGPMSTCLAGYGAIPQEVPTISVEPPRNPAQMERAIKGIVEGRYRWIVFASANAVKVVWDKIREFGLDARAFAGVHLAAVGRKTAQAITELGMTPELLPDKRHQNAQGLLEVFPEYDEELDPVGRVLVPRADIGGEVLVSGLEAAGWGVDEVVAYRTVRAAPPSAEVRAMIKSGGFDAVCFTSPSTVKNLVGIAGKPHQRTIISCIGPSTAAAARELGLRVDVVPEVADIPSLVDALAAHVAALRAAGQLPPPKKKRRARRKSTR